MDKPVDNLRSNLPDPYEEKSRHFLARERYFWILHTLAWILTLRAMGHRVGFETYLSEGQLQYEWIFLAYVWIGYYMIGTFTVLVFRRFYYRQRWYERRFIGSLPLVLMVALPGGLAIAFLVDFTLNAMLGFPFRIYNETGELISRSAIGDALYGALTMFIVLVLWLLVFLGVEGAINARNLAVRSLALENNLKEARLNALSGQINPHFLFNALNNTRFMIKRDADRAEDSLVALSEILRHSLGTSQKEKVLLSEELVIVERYLALMKNQMKDRLAYDIEADALPPGIQIPPMIIQMLAENAIKHGVEQIREGGRVNIQCAARDGRLAIAVRNTASPAGAQDANPGDEGNDAGKGVGLANIRNRLALIYGVGASLSMVHQGDEFRVLVELPCEQAV